MAVLVVSEDPHVGRAVALVDHPEQRLEALAQPDADATVGAGLERAISLRARLDRVEVLGIERVVEVRSHLDPLALPDACIDLNNSGP